MCVCVYTHNAETPEKKSMGQYSLHINGIWKLAKINEAWHGFQDKTFS